MIETVVGTIAYAPRIAGCLHVSELFAANRPERLGGNGLFT